MDLSSVCNTYFRSDQFWEAFRDLSCQYWTRDEHGGTFGNRRREMVWWKAALFAYLVIVQVHTSICSEKRVDEEYQGKLKSKWGCWAAPSDAISLHFWSNPWGYSGRISTFKNEVEWFIFPWDVFQQTVSDQFQFYSCLRFIFIVTVHCSNGSQFKASKRLARRSTIPCNLRVFINQ